uniref:DUF1707 domain-containing protein n=1 Tax=Steinernema glaseri TaxID=37863 RepID=A0A1I7YA14_9BILA
MGGWKLESGRFLILAAFPVAAFWYFNRPGIFKEFMKGYKVPESASGDAAMAAFKEQISEPKSKEEEKFLREQASIEEARRIREGIFRF